MPNYTWYSEKLDEAVEVFASIADRDTPPDLEPHDWVRVFEMPAVKRRTYLDGQRSDLTDFKQIAKLKSQAADLPRDDAQRKDIGAEIAGRQRPNKKVTKGV